MWLAMTTGFLPSKRRPLPGDTVLWRARADLGHSVRVEQKRPEPILIRPDFAEPPNAARSQAMESR